jgi:phosphate transport system substrate-binding protein
VAGTLALGVIGCGGESGGSGGSGGGAATENLAGTIQIDGSSTVQPFAQAAAELFGEEAPNVRITVGGSGTGDGFEKFCKGETDVSTASRPIDPEEEDACEQEDVSPSEIQVANDGIAVLTNKQLTVDCMKTSEIKQILEPDSKVKSLRDVNPRFPDAQASLFTPGEESGTFDFFTEELLETDAEQRTEGVQTSADDNQIVTGISGEPGGFGYAGFSFFEQNQDKLNAVAVDDGEGCVRPTSQTIQNNEYKPLSRPLFMYPSAKAVARPEVKAFFDFAIKNQQKIAEAAKIVPMTGEQATKAQQDLTKAEG